MESRSFSSWGSPFQNLACSNKFWLCRSHYLSSKFFTSLGVLPSRNSKTRVFKVVILEKANNRRIKNFFIILASFAKNYSWELGYESREGFLDTSFSLSVDSSSYTLTILVVISFEKYIFKKYSRRVTSFRVGIINYSSFEMHKFVGFFFYVFFLYHVWTSLFYFFLFTKIDLFLELVKLNV